jgi:ribonuclease HI
VSAASGAATGADQKPKVELYTDGACSGNPGPGGWAFILRHPASGKEIKRSGGERETTNNRMEMTAVLEGLRALTRASVVELYSDSQYVLKGLNEWLKGWKAKGWKTADKKPVKNQDLWMELDALKAKHSVTFHWVRGHNEHPENEECDRMAVEARDAAAR